MDISYSFTCSNCRRDFGFTLWVGSDYPRKCRALVKDIEKGKYGEEWQRLFSSRPDTVVSAENCLYVCKSCGHWEISPSLAIYVPRKNGRPAPAPKRGTPRDDSLCVMPDELESFENYYLLKSYPHLCSGCGTRMRKGNVRHLLSLCCPKCGKDTEPSLKACWLNGDEDDIYYGEEDE